MSRGADTPGVFGHAAISAPSAVGVSSAELRDDLPALALFGMGITMPMVAWMRSRGHGWPASTEMAASMMIPTVGVIALLWLGVVEDTGARSSSSMS